MRISQVNLKDTLFGKMNETPALKIGKVYNMEVTKFEGNRAQLQYRGKEIQAEFKKSGEFSLKPGTNIQVKVEGQEGEKILVKWMDKPSEGLSPLAKNDLKNLLLSQRMAPTEENLETVEKLLRHKLPVTRENMLKVLQGIKSESMSQSLRIDTAIFLMERNLPLHPLLAKLVSKYLKQEGLTGKKLEEFMFIQEDEGEVSEEKVSKERIKEQLKNYILTFEDDENTEGPRELGKRIMEGFQEMEYREKGKDVYREIGKIFSSYKIPMDQSLKEVIEHIFVQPMLNRSNERGIPYLYYQMPIQWGKKYETLEFFVLPDEKTKKLFYKKKIHGVFSIHTHEMGQIKVDFKMEDKEIDIKIGSETQGVMELIQEHTHLLEKFLYESDYRVKDITCFIDEQKSFKYVEKLMAVPEQKLDIKV